MEKNDIARKKALTLDQVHLFYVGNIYTDFQPNYFFASSLDFYLEPKGARQRSLIRSSSTAENTKKHEEAKTTYANVDKIQ